MAVPSPLNALRRRLQRSLQNCDLILCAQQGRSFQATAHSLRLHSCGKFRDAVYNALCIWSYNFIYALAGIVTRTSSRCATKRCIPEGIREGAGRQTRVAQVAPRVGALLAVRHVRQQHARSGSLQMQATCCVIRHLLDADTHDTGLPAAGFEAATSTPCTVVLSRHDWARHPCIRLYICGAHLAILGCSRCSLHELEPHLECRLFHLPQSRQAKVRSIESVSGHAGRPARLSYATQTTM